MELSRRREVQLYSDNLTDFCKDNQLYLELLKDHVDELDKMKQYDAAIKQSQTVGEISRLAKSSDPRNLAVMFTRLERGSDGHLFAGPARTGEYEDSRSSHSKYEDNPFCYLCSTIEQHRKHLMRTEKKIRGKKRIPYEAPKPFVPPKPPSPKPLSKECLYRVTVKTGTDIKAACAAPVYITLRGERDTLSRSRLKKKFGSLAFFFDSGSTEVFHLRGPKIGRLTDMTIGMEIEEEAATAAAVPTSTFKTLELTPGGQEKPKKQRHRWLLESVIVKDYALGLEYHFNIDTWLRSNRRDKVRLAPTTTAKSLAHAGRGILVTTYTGRKATSGTDCRVYISLLGGSGAGARHELRRPVEDNGDRGGDRTGGASRGIFRPGGKDVFELYVEDFAELKGIRLELDTQNVKADKADRRTKSERDRSSDGSRTWFVDQVIVKDIKTGQKWLFTISEWLNEDAPVKEFWTVKDVNSKTGAIYNQTTQYQIVTKTGSKDFAGTDSTVYLALFDKDGRRCDIELRDEDKNKFERGKTDTMTETARVIDTPVKLKVSISGKGVAPDWYMDGIVVTKYLVTEEILQYLQRLQFSNKMPEGLTQDKGKILFESADARDKQRKRQKTAEADKRGGREASRSGKKQKKKHSSSKDSVDNSIGAFGRSRRTSPRSSKLSSSGSSGSSDEDEDPMKSKASSDSDSDDSVKSHDDFDPEHGSVRLPYAVEVSFKPNSKDQAWLKKDKTVELMASDSGKMLYRQLRLRSDNEAFERIRQELLEKQRIEEEKKKKQQKKKQEKMQEQQQQRRVAASKAKSSRGRNSSTDSSGSSSSTDAGKRRAPRGGKSPATADNKKPLNRSRKLTSDSDSSLDAFGKPKRTSKSDDKKLPPGKRLSESLEAKRSARAAEGLNGGRGGRQELDKTRDGLSSAKDQLRSPRGLSGDRTGNGTSLKKVDDRSLMDRSNARGRQDFDKASDKKLSGGLDSTGRSAKLANELDRSKDRKPLDPSKGRDRFESEKRNLRDFDGGLGRADFDKGPDRSRIGPDRSVRDRFDADKSLARSDLDRKPQDRGALGKGSRESSPREVDRTTNRFGVETVRQARLSRLNRDGSLDAAPSGRLDKGENRSNLSNRGRSGLDLETDGDRSSLSRRGRSGLDLETGDDRSSLNRRGRSGLDLETGDDRSSLNRRGRSGLDLETGGDRSNLSGKGGSGFDFNRDRDRQDFDKGRERRLGGGALAAGPLDNPRIVVTATDGRQGDPVVARNSGRVRQRSFNFD